MVTRSFKLRRAERLSVQETIPSRNFPVKLFSHPVRTGDWMGRLQSFDSIDIKLPISRHRIFAYDVCYSCQMATLPPDRRGRKRQHTASHLSATAFKLFESQGYEAVSMEQIADKADVAKATLYKYFPVKEALIAHRFRDDIAAGMAERAPALAAHKTYESRMRYLLRESAAWHMERKIYLPHYLRFLTSQAHYGEEVAHASTYDSGTRKILTLMFQAAQQSGDVACEQSAAQLAWSFEYLLFGAVTAWLTDPSRNLEVRFLAAFDLTLHGVAMPVKSRRSKSRLPSKKS
jgi:AcrR family transcriptional regulator